MTQPEFDPDRHEQEVAERYRLLAKVALFDEMIDYHLDGKCTFDEAVEQYQHDLQDI